MNTSKTVLFISAGPINRRIREGQKRTTTGLNGGVEMLSLNGHTALLLQNNARVFNGGNETVRMIEDAAQVNLLDMERVVISLADIGRGIVRPLTMYLPASKTCWVLCRHSRSFSEHIARLGHHDSIMLNARDCSGHSLGRLVDEYIDSGRLEPANRDDLIVLAPFASQRPSSQAELRA